MKNINFKQLVPYFAAIFIFLIIVMGYFSPLLEGKKAPAGGYHQLERDVERDNRFQSKNR